MSEKETAALLARIQPLLDGIDPACDLSSETRAAIEFAELSGTAMGDEAKKGLELVDRGVITGDQLRAILLAHYL